MKIAVAGTGYVGLVTGVVLAEIGHSVTCVDVDEKKIKIMNSGKSPIYEEGLEELMLKNKDKLTYTTDYKKAYSDVDVIFIGVGTPEREDGSANLDYVYSVCSQIAESVKNDVVVVVKSTVPIGTNGKIENYLREKLINKVNLFVVSNPEFLAQGTAVHDTLYASRIVVGVEDKRAGNIMKKLYEPLTKVPYNVPYLVMNRTSAEMVKYASNDFLALKISYINEISNFCEKVGADITDVTLGMSKDARIGDKFLNSGIGYGGSCFPKDTKALHWLSREVDTEIKTIKACIEVNKNQKLMLFNKLKDDYKSLSGLNVAVLGCSFKPGTDDLREAPSIDNVNLLLEYGCNVNVYDPLKLSLEAFSHIFSNKVNYYDNIDDCINGVDVVLIMTEHKEIKEYNLKNYVFYMKKAVIYDGRNCYKLDDICKYNVKYVSMGRSVVNNLEEINNG